MFKHFLAKRQRRFRYSNSSGKQTLPDRAHLIHVSSFSRVRAVALSHISVPVQQTPSSTPKPIELYPRVI